MKLNAAVEWSKEEVSIGPLRLRNRIIRSGCFEGMCPDGAPSEALIRHHRDVAAGGAALTTVAYCSVSPDGRSYATEMFIRPDIVPLLRRLTDAVHAEGGAASLQIGHCGLFADPHVIRTKPIAPSRVFCLYRLSYARPMLEDDLKRVSRDFEIATILAKEANFDAVEVHAGHGYLLSQFLSPWSNRRKDAYGGDLDGRMRFPVEVLQRVREAAGPRMAVIVKMNLEDGFKGGLSPDEAVQIARAFEQAGADALVGSGGFTSRTPFYMLRGRVPVAEMVRNERNPIRRLGLKAFGRFVVEEYPFKTCFFLEVARPVVSAVKIPVVLLGGVCGPNDLELARNNGFSLVGMGRALIRDPHFPKSLWRGEASDCDHCNRCVAAMDAGGVHCVTRIEEQSYGRRIDS